MCNDARPPVGGTLAAEAVHRHIDDVRELPREVLDVHAGAAVHLGRVLACAERDA
jgi:hypothetical protein